MVDLGTPGARLARIRERLRVERHAKGVYTEEERILALPREELEDQGHDLARKWTHLLRRHPRAPSLWPIQGVILETASRAIAPRGLLGNVGVGKGKTLAFALLHRAFGVSGADTLLLIPPDLREDTRRAHEDWAQHFDFEAPRVVAYSELSQPKASDLLTRLAPAVVLADECQNLRHATAARTKRFLRYMEANPDTRFAGMSGTLSGGSLEDYTHLAELALREGSPLPRTQALLDAWCSVLDWDGVPDEAARTKFRPVFDWAEVRRAYDVLGARCAYNTRFRSAPGVITTQSPSCDAEVLLLARRPETSPAIQDALETLRDEYVLPDGTEVVDALHHHRAAHQLCMGYYYRWDWPGEPDYEWLQARQTWAAAVREYLAGYSREGCDSPHLVEQYVLDAPRAPVSLRQALAAWQVQRAKPAPPTVPVWLDMGVVADAVTWLAGQERALLWFSSRAVGEALALFGIPVYWEGDIETPRAALSIPVYHKGRNLQAWATQYVVEPPSNAATWEQMLGRTHRAGQMAPVVTVEVAQHLWPLWQAMRTAFRQARFIEETSLQRQKLNLAQHVGGFRY